MRTLPSSLRKQLETSVLAARRAAEAASRAAVESLGVFADRRPEHLDSGRAALRNRLRAKWRQLGNDRALLVAECAYEQWHRLLFARFLAENGLLLHPQFHAPVTLSECEELAVDLGEPDAWSVAARFAAEILPGIFRPDDPCVRLRLAPEGRHALEQILDAIPAETFTADDSLGWVYQFWQKDEKDEVNASERKISGSDLGPVTQLFTENYMVRFLLENSLGAWWAARHPNSPLIEGFEYLRYDDGKPAVGTFEGWPDRLAEVTVMDPCCGSGHFIVEAFSMLWQMRAEEEGLAPIEAQDAVLRENLFGLELDPRCVQIAMFNVALQAWKVGDGWRQLPMPNIACSGIPVKAPVEQWKALANGDQRLENALVRLHILFRDADTLGSLIDPKRATEIADPSGLQTSLEDVDWNDVAPLIAAQGGQETSDPVTEVLGVNAGSLARAADYLSRQYTLAITNVPYLTGKRQGSTLFRYVSTLYPKGKADLATAFICRLSNFAQGSYFIVTPENWLNLTSYTKLREDITASCEIQIIVRLGPGAFGQISGEVVKPIMAGIASKRPSPTHEFAVLDVLNFVGSEAKAQSLKVLPVAYRSQARQRSHADCRILLNDLPDFPLMSSFAECWAGVQTGDYPRFGRFFWEVRLPDDVWRYQLSTVSESVAYGGREHVLRWADVVRFGQEMHATGGSVTVRAYRGSESWDRPGIAISAMGDLHATLYTGDVFDNNVGVISPNNGDLVAPLWHFCTSDEFRSLVRTIDNKMNVTNRTLSKVPIDIEHWRRVANEAGALPEPQSNNPTQWLFEGRPEVSTEPLQIGVSRLLGYRWPEQPESDDLDIFADVDGIVCLPAVAGEPSAADRVQQLLAAAFDRSWTPAKVKHLLEQTGSKKKSLTDWLRDEFFKQHCALFGNRPFVWHVWDGQRDGFSALINYHRLDRKTLEKLTYTYLGQDWVERQRAEVHDHVAGAEMRLAAALGLQKKLEAILGGEAPLDIYVRWKKTNEQAIGWEPDLNDGVRLNIRPFVEAGVLRAPFNIHWRKDRGKNPNDTERLNDIHLTRAQKLEARRKTGQA